jgi:hypothetical protein
MPAPLETFLALWHFIRSLCFAIDQDSIVPFSCKARVARYTFVLLVSDPSQSAVVNLMYAFSLAVNARFAKATVGNVGDLR